MAWFGRWRNDVVYVAPDKKGRVARLMWLNPLTNAEVLIPDGGETLKVIDRQIL